MRIREKEIDFKISRLKDASKLELALQKMEQTEKTINEKTKQKRNVPLSELIETMIDMLRAFFVDATGVDVLDDCDDVDEAKQAYVAFLKEVQAQKKTVIGFDLSDIK